MRRVVLEDLGLAKEVADLHGTSEVCPTRHIDDVLVCEHVASIDEYDIAQVSNDGIGEDPSNR